MSRIEKYFIIFYLLYIIIYTPCFFIFVPTHFDTVLPFHIVGMVLGLIFIIIVLRDIYKRNFPNPNSKVTWTILILMFWPSVFVYLPKYGFKSREISSNGDRKQELISQNKNKYFLFGAIVLVLVFIISFAFLSGSDSDNIQELAIRGNAKQVRKLLMKKPELANSVRERDQWTPLHGAAYNGNTDVVRVLIEAGADVNIRNINKRSPLHGAAEDGYLEIIKLLIEAGANPNYIGFQGSTALDWAIENNRINAVQYLREHGALTSDEIQNNQ